MVEIHATEQDLVRWATNLPLENIELHHLKMSSEKIQQADIVTIAIGGQVRTLKDRFQSWEN